MKIKSAIIALILLLGSCIQLTMPPVDTYLAALLSLAKTKNPAKVLPPTLAYTTSPFIFTQNLVTTAITPDTTGTITSCTASPALPAGLVLDNTTCAISGIPTVIQTATSYTITALNSIGSSSATILITVNLAPPSALTYASSPFTFTQNAAITTVTPTVTGTVTGCVSSPTLPAGLSLNATTCAISGTPTATQSATSYTITASNAYGNTTAAVSITVNLAPPSALTYSGTPYTMTKSVVITAITPTVVSTITNCISSPTLPAGLSLNTATCAITGTPTTLQAATSYTITASNAFGNTTAAINITVNDIAPSALSYAGTPFTFTKGVTITSVNPTVTGTPVSYSVTPALPTGLAINTATGQLAGNPTVLSGATTYTVTATNTGGSTAATISITINDVAPSALSYAGTPFTFTKGVTITAVNRTVTGTPVSYSVSPALPTGLAINTTTGQLAGTPTVLSGAATYTVTATNTGGSTTTTISITVNDVAPSALSYAGTPFTFMNGITITAVNPTVTGTPVSYSVSPALPTGLAINTTTGQLAGTPTVLSGATTYTVTATNTGGSTTATISITVVTPVTYTVGGTVSGLVGTLVLQNNGADNKTITTNGAFTFTTPIISGGTYAVTALTQPASGYYCAITGGTGTVAANVTTVAVSCTLTWTARTMPFNGFFMDVVYGNGIFVAVAWGGTQFATSPDGITWTLRTVPTSQGWLSVAFGNGKFVAVGWYGNIAVYSTNGITWSNSTMTTDGFAGTNARWHSVTFGNGLFVATSLNTTNLISTSPDGITWTSRTMPSSRIWSGVTYGNSVFVATAYNTNIAATSPDGITWTTRTLPTSSSWSPITFGNGLFLLPSASTSLFTSPDGITWTARTMPSSQSWSRVAYGNGKFVAIAAGPSNAAASSSDSITWTAMTLPASYNWNSVSFGNSRFIAVVNGATICASLP